MKNILKIIIVSQFLKVFKFLSALILLHNLVKSFLTSIKFTFDNLSRKIENPCLVIPCLVINKIYSKGVCNMKHTKNILKSLLITVMVLLLLLSSCTKDKNPTNTNNPPVTGGGENPCGGEEQS